ncbi:sigma-70 region 2 [Striga asiatica]|uniref:Sigma-70 region 2 n=1 Tax=Striga asiatica TaxID=4170 RepID=A0A5A7Q6Z7_STRAF|nr:sigma-70 region 2 [Striga asiatica]
MRTIFIILGQTTQDSKFINHNMLFVICTVYFQKDFEPPTTGPFAMPSRAKVGMSSISNVKNVPEHRGRHQGSTSKDKEPTLRKDQEVESHHEAECSSACLEEELNEDEVACVEALLEISLQNESPEDVELRASRRLSGQQPELQLDFDCSRALEYIIRGGKH